MSNKVLSLKKESSMRKMSILPVIAIFFVFCLSIHAQETKKKVDPDKFKKLTSEQKKTYKKNVEKARDTYQSSVRSYNEAVKRGEEGKKFCEKVRDTSKKIFDAAQNALSQKEQNLWKDPVLEKLKAEEKAKKDKEKQ